MPDITKCMGNNCQRREQCYRYTAKAEPVQWWTTIDADELEECEMFLEVRK